MEIRFLFHFSISSQKKSSYLNLTMPLYWSDLGRMAEQKEFPWRQYLQKHLVGWSEIDNDGEQNQLELETVGKPPPARPVGAKRGRGYRNSVEAVAGGGATCQGMQPWVRKAAPPKPWLSRERTREKNTLTSLSTCSLTTWLPISRTQRAERRPGSWVDIVHWVQPPRAQSRVKVLDESRDK